MVDQLPPSLADVAGRFIHYTLSSRDPRAARDFYGEMFGWRGDDDGRLAIAGRPFAEIVAGEPSPGWLGYVAVADLDEALELATERGGRALGATREAAGWGRVATILDPCGITIGLVEAPLRVPPDEEAPAPGAPAWNVLVTHQPEEELGFYLALFGWSFEQVDLDHELLRTYYVADRDGLATAGIIRAAAPDIPSHLCLCVAVADVEEALRRARALGATVAREPIEVREVGTYAVIEDRDRTRVAVLRWNGERRPW